MTNPNGYGGQLCAGTPVALGSPAWSAGAAWRGSPSPLAHAGGCALLGCTSPAIFFTSGVAEQRADVRVTQPWPLQGRTFQADPVRMVAGLAALSGAVEGCLATTGGFPGFGMSSHSITLPGLRVGRPAPTLNLAVLRG